MLSSPIDWSSKNTIERVFEQHNMNAQRLKRAWEIINQRWKDTDGRFYAYMTAHNVAAEVNFVGYPKPQLGDQPCP